MPQYVNIAGKSAFAVRQLFQCIVELRLGVSDMHEHGNIEAWALLQHPAGGKLLFKHVHGGEPNRHRVLSVSKRQSLRTLESLAFARAAVVVAAPMGSNCPEAGTIFGLAMLSGVVGLTADLSVDAESWVERWPHSVELAQFYRLTNPFRYRDCKRLKRAAMHARGRLFELSPESGLDEVQAALAGRNFIKTDISPLLPEPSIAALRVISR